MLFAPEGPAGGCASGECLPVAAEPPAPEPVTPAQVPNPLTGLTPEQQWQRAIEVVRGRSPRHGMSLAHGRLRSIGTDQVSVAFPRSAAFHESTCTGSGRVKVEAALSELFGRPIRLQIDNDVEGLPPSLAEREARQRDDREKNVEQTLRNHPAVRATLKILGGELEHIQLIEPEREADT